MNSRQALKQQSKEQISGNIPILFGCTLIAGIISLILNEIPHEIISFLGILLVSPVLGFNLSAIYLNLTHGQKPELGDLFKNSAMWGKIIILNLLMTLFIFLWTLLLIIPGIIKSYSYSMAYYILIENPDMSAMEALTASKEMMKGHKFELFILGLSFLPWILLCIFTIGIASIYVVPYIQTTLANFYNSIKPVTTHQNYTYDNSNSNYYA